MYKKLLFLTFLCASFGSINSLSAQDKLQFIVTSTADDSNARDKNPGDGICEDSFTDSNPDARPRCTLRAAIDEANAQAGDVTILVPGTLIGGSSGNYTISRTAPDMNFNTYENDNNFGDLDLNGDFNSLEIIGVGTPGPTISAGLIDRIFDIGTGKKVRLERMNINGGTARAGRNGNADGSGVGVDGEDGSDGGAIRINNNANVDIFQVSIEGSFTQSGGNGAAPATSTERTKGGKGGNGGNGGAIFIGEGATVSIKKSSIVGNGTGDAGSPAAGQANMSMPLVGGDGGDGGNGGAIYNLGDLEISQTTIANNTGGDPSSGATGSNGGEDGIAGEGGVGGIAVFGGNFSFSNTLIAGNVAGDDDQNGKQPGMDIFLADGASATSGENNLLSTNDSVEELFENSGLEFNDNNDLVGSGTGDDPNIINVKFGSLNQNADEAIKTLPLLSDSPAIDKGESGSEDDFDFDGRGFTRPVNGNYDIGAYEFNGKTTPVELVINEFDPVTPEDEQEFIEIANIGDYPVQLADHYVVTYGSDDKARFSFNLFNKIEPNEVVAVGDEAVANIKHGFGVEFAYEANGDVDDDPQELDNNVMSNIQGAVGLYQGDATDIPNGANGGNNVSTRKDILVYEVDPDPRNKNDRCELYNTTENCVVEDGQSGGSVQRNENGSYSLGSPNPGEANGGSSALAVDWLTFSATILGQTATLEWSTENEIAVTNYTVQYRTSNTEWTNVGKLAAQNKQERSDYSYSIDNLLPQTYFFRIQQNGATGATSYSAVRTLQPTAISVTLQISPNPLANEDAVLTYQLPVASHLELTIFDLNGRIIHQQNWTERAAGLFTYDIPVNQLSNKGFYMVRLQTTAGAVHQSFIKQ